MNKIIITGASRGIGFQTARHLAENPENQIMLIARNPRPLYKLLALSSHDNVIPFVFDLEKGNYQELLENVQKELGRIDILINNAAMLVNKPFRDLTLETWKQIFDVNLFSAVRLIQLLRPYFRKEKAHIVNVGSMGGFQGSAKFNGLSAYSASKGALAILSECLASEFVKDRITVNCVAFGAVQTEMLAEAFPNYKAPISAEEMGKFLADFALEGAKYFNGKIIPVAFTTP